ncbi:MAG: Flp family type IVb pilin [Solirubrobacterales bacterium]
MTSFVARLAKDENGATAIEYGLIAALISVAAIVGMKAIGTALNTQFGKIATTVTSP